MTIYGFYCCGKHYKKNPVTYKIQDLGYCWKQCVSGWKKLDELIDGATRMKKF